MMVKNMKISGNLRTFHKPGLIHVYVLMIGFKVIGVMKVSFVALSTIYSFEVTNSGSSFAIMVMKLERGW